MSACASVFGCVRVIAGGLRGVEKSVGSFAAGVTGTCEPLSSGCAEPGASILKEHEVPFTEPSPQPLVSALLIILIIYF